MMRCQQVIMFATCYYSFYLEKKRQILITSAKPTACWFVNKRTSSIMKKYLINARLPAKLNYVYFHSKSIEISRNSNEIFFVCFFKTVLVHTDLIVISQTEISERRRRRRASHGQNNNNANGARPGCRESEEAKKPKVRCAEEWSQVATKKGVN